MGAYYLLWLKGAIPSEVADLAALVTLLGGASLPLGLGWTGAAAWMDSLGTVSERLSGCRVFTYSDCRCWWAKSQMISKALVDLGVLIIM